MGPGIFHPGYQEQVEGAYAPGGTGGLLQWGRGYSTPDTSSGRSQTAAWSSRFNGAGDIPPRIQERRVARQPPLQGFNGAGDIPPRILPDYMTPWAAPPWLQWGRGYSTPDTIVPGLGSIPAMIWLQWGRGYSTPDTRRARTGGRRSCGRCFNGAGDIPPRIPGGFHRSSAPRSSASMGPGIFHPGYLSSAALPSRTVRVLQWGRGYSTPDTRRGVI